MSKKLVYVAGPYTGSTHDSRSFAEINSNIMRARMWSVEVWRAGAVALCPHLNTYHFELDAGLPAEAYYQGDLIMLAKCDAMFVIPNSERSRGVALERDFCIEHGIPVFDSFTEMKAWIDK